MSMVRDFSKGGNFLDVNYDEYVIINTINKNHADNGKIFRRGYDYSSARTISGYRAYKDGQQIIGGTVQEYSGATYEFDENITAGGAVYIGTVVGPAGRSPHLKILSYDDIKTIQEGFQTQKSQGSMTLEQEDLLPGKYIEDNKIKYNDSILWYCASVRNENNDDSIAYIGLKIPYLVTEFETEAVSSYNSEGYIEDMTKIERIDDFLHPFYEKWKISIPKGIKGDSFKNIYFTTFEALTQLKVFISQNNYYKYNSVQDTFIYGDIDDNEETSLGNNNIDINIHSQNYHIIPKTQIVVCEQFNYDEEENPSQPMKIHFLGVINQIIQDDFIINDNGDFHIGFTDGTTIDKKGFFKNIDNIIFNEDENNNVTLQILFNTQLNQQGIKDAVEYPLKFIKNISFENNGTVLVDFTDGTSYTKENVFKNITDVYFSNDQLIIELNDSTSITKNISWISNIMVEDNGDIIIERNGNNIAEPNPLNHMKWISNIIYNRESNQTIITYNDDSVDTFDNTFKSISSVQVDEASNELVISYNNGEQASRISLAGGLIRNVSYQDGNFIVDYTGGKASDSFPVNYPAQVEFNNVDPEEDDYILRIRALNGDIIFESDKAIDSIYDTRITPSDYHLVILFSSPETRREITNQGKAYPSSITSLRDGKTYSGWLDLGSIFVKSGIFIGLNLDHTDFGYSDSAADIQAFNNLSISQIITKLNQDYPTGLQGNLLDEKIITVGEPQSDKKFFGFNYSYQNNSDDFKGWYYLGAIDHVDNIICCAMGTYDEFVEEGSIAESIAEDGLYFIVQE